MQWQYYDFMGIFMIIFHKKEVLSVRVHYEKRKRFRKCLRRNLIVYIFIYGYNVGDTGGASDDKRAVFEFT